MVPHRCLVRRQFRLFVIFLLFSPGITNHILGQLYAPPEPLSMWDTWLYQEENNYHLFFLQSEPGLIWNTIGRAVSSDLLYWQQLPSIPTKGIYGSWDENPTLTGMTIKVDSGYILFYGSDKDGQKIGTMFSSDLKHWEKNPLNPILEPKPPYYCDTDWRDIFIYYNVSDECWHGFVCAQTPQILADGRIKNSACIAHLTTQNFSDWHYLPPVYADSNFFSMEVPDYFEMNGYHYLLFSNAGNVRSTSGRKNARGTYYIMSDQRDGPYHLPEAPLLLGSGMNRFDVYVGRTIRYKNERLLYYQTVGGKVSWGIPKIIRQNEDGTLWLEYWQDFDKLDKGILAEDFSKVISNNITGKGFWRKQGHSIFGETPSNQSCILWLPVQAADAMISFKIKMISAGKTGVIWKWKEDNGEGILIDKNENNLTLNKFTSWGNRISSETVDRIHEEKIGTTYHHCRIILRGERIEFYLNDHWKFNTLMEPVPEGIIGLYLESGTAEFRNIRITEIEPMKLSSTAGPENKHPEKYSSVKNDLCVLTNPSIQRDRSGQVTITSPYKNEKIMYSIEGQSSNKFKMYTEPFLFPGKGTIQAMISHENPDSCVTSSLAFEQLKIEKPEIVPKNAFFYKNVDVELASTLEGARTYYTLDGSRPTTYSLLYKDPIKIDRKLTLRAVSFDNGFISSDESRSDYYPVTFTNRLKYYLYEGVWRNTPDYFHLTPIDSGDVSQIRLEDIELSDYENYALLFHGFIRIEKEGCYTFFIASNDGSQLSVNSYKVVDNDGSHGLQEKSGDIILKEGVHLIEVRYFQMGGGQALHVSYEGPGQKKQEIPASVFIVAKE